MEMSDDIEDLMGVDCDEIERQLLPPNALRNSKITHTSAIAPPQGYLFLDKTVSMEERTKKMPFLYRYR